MIRKAITLAALVLFSPGALAQASATGDTAERSPACSFDVVARGEPANLRLAVTARCVPAIDRLEFDQQDRRAIGNVRTLAGDPAASTARGWQTGGGGLQYEVDLASRVANGSASRDTALTSDTLMAPLDTWLGMPEPTRFDAELHVRMTTPPGLYALNAMEPLDEREPNRSRLTAGGLSFAGYSLFSTRPAQTVEVAGKDGRVVPIMVHAGADDFAVGTASLTNWVRYFAQLSAEYWQGFPVDRLLVAILPSGNSDRVVFGRVRGGGGGTLQVVAGRNVALETLYRRDWVLTHELLHLAQPNLPKDGMWLMEGMATYIEPLLRHIAGLYTADQVWSEWLNGMPAGSLGLNTQGLHRANAYWGGALALLAANVAIIQDTDGRKSIADCLRAGLWSVGNATVRAQTSSVISACDQAVNAIALSQFLTRHTAAAEFNLPQLWQTLGISKAGNTVTYTDNAKAAALRSAILAPPNGFTAPPLPAEMRPLN